MDNEKPVSNTQNQYSIAGTQRVFTYATALDLNMGYYIIRLDPDSSKICTIIFLQGKYSDP